MPQRRQLRAKDYGRCNGCNRLCEKASLKPGPEGGNYGPECLPRVIAAWHDSVQSLRDAIRADADEVELS